MRNFVNILSRQIICPNEDCYHTPGRRPDIQIGGGDSISFCYFCFDSRSLSFAFRFHLVVCFGSCHLTLYSARSKQHIFQIFCLRYRFVLNVFVLFSFRFRFQFVFVCPFFGSGRLALYSARSKLTFFNIFVFDFVLF